MKKWNNMFLFNFTIGNPWAKDTEFKRIFSYYKSVFKNKTLEIDFYKSSPYDIFQLDIDARFAGSDHAKISIELVVLYYTFSIGLIDNRHWDYDNGRWEVYPSEDED